MVGENLSHTLLNVNDQSVVEFSEACAGTLEASYYRGPNNWQERTLVAIKTEEQKVFTMDADSSNSMKSPNPHSGFPGNNLLGVMNHSTVRRLLPVECERLMGFPDNHTKIEWNGKSSDECPDAPRYKACGNSMCVNVMEWIGEQIDKVEASKCE